MKPWTRLWLLCWISLMLALVVTAARPTAKAGHVPVRETPIIFSSGDDLIIESYQTGERNTSKAAPTLQAYSVSTSAEQAFRDALVFLEQTIPGGWWGLDPDKVDSVVPHFQSIVDEYPASDVADDALWFIAMLRSSTNPDPISYPPQPRIIDPVPLWQDVINSYPQGQFHVLSVLSNRYAPSSYRPTLYTSTAAEAQYDLAREFGATGVYTEEIAALRQLVLTYPNSDRASTAQWRIALDAYAMYYNDSSWYLTVLSETQTLLDEYPLDHENGGYATNLAGDAMIRQWDLANLSWWADQLATSYSPNNYVAEITFGRSWARWNNSPVSVYIDSGGASATQVQDVKDGLLTWAILITPSLEFDFSGTASSYDVSISFCAGCGSGCFLSQTAGYTSEYNWSYVAMADMYRATCRLNTSLSAEQFRRTATHEAGHALGLTGHSFDESDLMFYSSSTGDGQLSARDIETFRLLYGGVNSEQVAPIVTIIHSPDPVITRTYASFVWTAHDNYTPWHFIRHRYRLDGGVWQGGNELKESDHTDMSLLLMNLPPGIHTFEVQVRDAANNESSIGSYSFKVVYPFTAYLPMVAKE